MKSLPEAKAKRFILIPLAEEISKLPNIDSAMWLIVVMPMKINNKKEQAELKLHIWYNLRRKEW